MSEAADFAAVAITLYVAHHVGDYWVQTDHQARHKGDAGQAGRDACSMHVTTYVITQWMFMVMLKVMLGVGVSTLGLAALLLVSSVTHYLADRREHGLMFWLAGKLPGKAAFLALGRPRQAQIYRFHNMITEDGQEVRIEITDPPQLATGGWALDQAWHIFWGVFVAALLAVTL